MKRRGEVRVYTVEDLEEYCARWAEELTPLDVLEEELKADEERARWEYEKRRDGSELEQSYAMGANDTCEPIDHC